MQTRLYHRALPVLFCAACAAAPASAALTARASIADMRFSVVDLTPDDGEPAGFSIAGYSANLITRLETHGDRVADHDNPAAGMPGRAEVSAPRLGAVTYTSGAVGEMFSEIRLAAGVVELSAEGSQNWRLDLLPNSRLLIEGTTAVEARWTPQPARSDYFFEAATHMTLWADGRPALDVGQWYRFSGNDAAQEIRETEDYTYTYENTGDAAIPLYFSGGAWVGGRATVSAVPEPGALPMLLSGIALLPVWRRLRRAAPQPCREAI